MTSVIIKGGNLDPDTDIQRGKMMGKWPCDDGCRDWIDAAVSQEHQGPPAIPEAGRGQEGSHPESEGA